MNITHFTIYDFHSGSPETEKSKNVLKRQSVISSLLSHNLKSRSICSQRKKTRENCDIHDIFLIVRERVVSQLTLIYKRNTAVMPFHIIHDILRALSPV